MTFFERQPECPSLIQRHPGADPHVMLRYKPGLHLRKRRIGLAHHAGMKDAQEPTRPALRHARHSGEWCAGINGVDADGRWLTLMSYTTPAV
jgi:hypothetical protein